MPESNAYNFMEVTDFVEEREINDIEMIIAQEAIKPVFQPIISLRDGSLIGHEALSRITDKSEKYNIEKLFKIAVKGNMTWALERLCRRKALTEIFKKHPKNYCHKLFLNVSPGIIYDMKFRTGFTSEYIDKYSTQTDQIVFEITEREAVTDHKGFINLISHYKLQGYQIAIDDVGSGYSGLNLVCDIQPHYIKIDMNIVRNIHRNNIKSAVVKGLVELSNLTNIKLIAEGIETSEELESLINLGVHYGQGYLTGYPMNEPHEASYEILSLIRELNFKKHTMNNNNITSYYIRNIANKGMTISPNVSVDDIMKHFEKHQHLVGVCVEYEGRVLGIITKEKLMSRLSGRFGFSLNQHKEVTSIMDNNFLEVDTLMPINTVSKMAMERDHERLYDFIVILENGLYYGIVTIRDLLQKATEIDVTMARSANPLTGLPGNIIIEKEIAHCIQEKNQYTIIYIDLDNFKAYNDVYGFENGDLVIKEISAILQEKAKTDGFVGHVGGDDFVMIFKRPVEKSLLSEIESDFERRVLAYYSDDDKKRGFIIAHDRDGNTDRFPMLSVTIVSVSSDEKTYTSNYELSKDLAARKKSSKKQKKKGKK